jgi:hypothetical protein
LPLDFNPNKGRIVLLAIMMNMLTPMEGKARLANNG